MTEILCYLLSALVLCLAFFTRPTHAACPHGWWMPEGVRRTGEFVCRPVPVGDDVRTPRGILVDHSVQPDGHVYLRVYCQPNAIPTIVDTTVFCTREN